MIPEFNLLLADDDDSDIFLFQRALKEAQLSPKLTIARDGQEVIDLLSQRRLEADDRMPSLNVLDLKMPRRTGLEALEWIRQEPVLRTLPVIIFSSSSRSQDIETAYALGANAFIVKPASTIQRREFTQFLRQWVLFTQPPLAATDGYRVAHAAHASGAFRLPQTGAV